MLQVQDLRKRFGDILAVDGVSFSVAEGECFGLLGPNGAGKSTTISMLIGAVTPDSGEASLDGEVISLRSFAAKRKIGYVPQEIALYENLNSHANLRFFGSLYGVGGQELEQRIAEVLAIVSLTDRAHEPVQGFSGGMKRRLNIACALMHRPKLLILDEPTAGVDPQSRNAIFECLEALRAQGMALVYTTHYMEEVVRLCERIAIMDHGKVVACDTLPALLQLLPTTGGVEIELEDEPLPHSFGPDVRVTGSTLHVNSNDPNRDLAALLTTLSLQNRRFRTIKSISPTLEEVFLHLTGRTLRD